MNKYDFSNLPQKIKVNGTFDDTCEVEFSDKSLQALNSGRLKVKINRLGNQPIISNLKVYLGCIEGNINISTGRNNSTITLGDESSGTYNFRLWRNSKISIGEKTTSNGILVICDKSEFICGEDCMFSENILVQTADQHGIVDLNTGEIINDKFKSITLGDHVWLGRQCVLTSGSSVGSGSIIGTASTVTSIIPDKTIAVGVPARIIKENHTWTRASSKLDIFSLKYLNE